MGTLLNFIHSENWAWWRLRFLMALVGLGAGVALFRLPLASAFLLFGGIAVVLGSLLWTPLIGVGVTLFLAPLWAWLRADWPQIDPLLGQYFFLLTVAVWVIRGLIKRDFRIPAPPLLFPFLVFMGAILLSLWTSADSATGFMEFAKWAQISVMFFLVYDNFKGNNAEQQIVSFVLVLIGIVVFQSVFGLWQFGLRGDGPDHFAIDARFYRAYGTFEQPNPFGGFMGMMGALLTGLFATLLLEFFQLHRKFSLWFLGLAVPLLLTVGALLASWSRGAWMGFGAALLIMVALLPRRSGWGLLVLSLLMLGTLGLYSADLLPASVLSRMTGFLDYTRFEDVRGVAINDVNYAVLERMAHWQTALDMWRENFWLGVGFGCYEPAYPDYRLINWPMALGHAHNYYLNLLAETGLLGLFAYLFFLGALLIRLWQAVRRLDGWQRGLAIGLIGSFTHFGVHNLVDNILVNNTHLYFGVLLALAAWLVGKSADNNKT